MIIAYLKAQGLYRVYDGSVPDPDYSGDLMELDMATVKPALSGPKRPHDKVNMEDMKTDFNNCLSSPVGFKGFGIDEDKMAASSTFTFEGEEFTLKHGSIVIASITSCTNTSNPSVMLQAGLLAKKAVERGLKTKPYIWTSLSPGSGVVTKYFENAGVNQYLDQLGFTTAGYGCMTCIGNSGTLPAEVIEAINENDLVASAVLSGNRNFEGRVSPNTRANYLASPPLVVAYAIAGTVDINFEESPVGIDSEGKPVMLSEIWPSRDEVEAFVSEHVTPSLFKEFYANTLTRNERWNNLEAPQGDLFAWTEDSTYIHHPPFFQGMTKEAPTTATPIQNARCLLLFGDSVTTDHISPAGNIAKTSQAAKWLASRGIEQKDFNSYGARRGNDEVMARGTFANIRLVNKLVPRAGPTTMYFPTNEEIPIFEAAARYIESGTQTIILAGKEYGSGSSRDWAAKGPYLQGVKAVIAESYERIHRSNLLGMGILPLQFNAGDSSESLGLNGQEAFSFDLGDSISVGQTITVSTDSGKSFTVKSRLDTDPEVAYFMNGGILRYVLRKLI